MSQPEAHPIRNGVIATVVGGVILIVLGFLWAPVRLLFRFLWAAIVACWHWLATNHLAPGWLLVLLAVCTVVLVVSRALSFARNMSGVAPHMSYTSDNMFGALWHWSWLGGQIRNLWSSCPVCSAELVQLNERDNYLMSQTHAKFYCEHCREVRVDMPGGGHQYALSAVEREIRRRLRISQERTSGVTS